MQKSFQPSVFTKKDTLKMPKKKSIYNKAYKFRKVRVIVIEICCKDS